MPPNPSRPPPASLAAAATPCTLPPPGSLSTLLSPSLCSHSPAGPSPATRSTDTRSSLRPPCPAPRPPLIPLSSPLLSPSECPSRPSRARPDYPCTRAVQPERPLATPTPSTPAPSSTLLPRPHQDVAKPTPCAPNTTGPEPLRPTALRHSPSPDRLRSRQDRRNQPKPLHPRSSPHLAAPAPTVLFCVNGVYCVHFLSLPHYSLSPLMAAMKIRPPLSLRGSLSLSLLYKLDAKPSPSPCPNSPSRSLLSVLSPSPFAVMKFVIGPSASVCRSTELHPCLRAVRRSPSVPESVKLAHAAPLRPCPRRSPSSVHPRLKTTQNNLNSFLSCLNL
jgi:hypothetical protein